MSRNFYRGLLFFLIIIIITFTLVSCSSLPGNQTVQVTAAIESTDTVISLKDTSEAVVKMEKSKGQNKVVTNQPQSTAQSGTSLEFKESEEFTKFIASGELKLQISKKGEPFMETSPELARKMLNIFKEYYEIPVDSPHGEEVMPVDTDDYTYIFRFEGFNDIKLFNNTDFVFIGSDDYFYEDNSMGIINEALKYLKKVTNGSKTVYTAAKGELQPFRINDGERVYDSFMDDLNSDSVKENIEIYFDGELSLWIDGTKHLFDADSILYYVNMPDRQAFSSDRLVPVLTLIPDRDGKMIVLSYTHRGADNMHEVFYTMKYDNKGKFKYYKLPEIKNVVSSYKNGEIFFNFRDYSLKEKIPYSRQDYDKDSEYSSGKGASPEEFMTGIDLFYINKPQRFKLEDTNSDGDIELTVSTFISREFRFYICSSDITYALRDAKWIPIRIHLERDNN